MKTTFYTLALILGLLSCDHSTHAQQNDQVPNVKQIKVSELSDVAKISNTIFLDVRTPEEFNKGYIPNAKHIDFYSDNFKQQLQQLDQANTYIVYCKSGMRSQQASDLMITLDFKNVYNLVGGYDAWKQ